jgi:xylulokinase
VAYLIGIDIGSSAVKAGVVTAEGQVRAVARHAYPTDEPQPGFKEVDPELWWERAVACLREVTEGLPGEDILAVCAIGHISSLTFVDGMGRPVRRSLGFQDQRADNELADLYDRFSREELVSLLGIDLPPSATWPLPKLIWLRKHEPETLRKTRCLLQAKDFVNLRLTGEFATDPSSSRGLADQTTGLVAGSVLDSLGIDPQLLPRPYDHMSVIGGVSGQAAQITGLRRGLPVVCGWNDQNACVLGSGAVAVGSGFNVTGTSEHMGLVTGRHYPNPNVMCGPFLKGRRLLYGATLSGGGSLDWLSKATARPIADLLTLAASVPAGSDSLLFLPYLEGERAPVWDRDAAGAFVGLRTRHTQAHMSRAVLEGVGFSLRQIRDVIEAESGHTPSEVTVSGGAARIRLWNQIKADIWGRTVSIPSSSETGVLGAAILAAVAAGCHPDCEAAAGRMVRQDCAVLPSPDAAAVYNRLYEAYLELYPALRSVFGRLARSGERLRSNNHV